MLTALSKLESQTQLLHSHSQSIAKLEVQIGQLANALNQREEWKLSSQPLPKPKGNYMIDEHASSNSHHEQVQGNTNLRSGGIVNNRVEKRRTEQIGPTEKPKQAKGNEVISEVPYSATDLFETDYQPKASFSQCLKEPNGNTDAQPHIFNVAHHPSFIDPIFGSQF